MRNIIKIACIIVTYCTCLLGVRQGWLPPNSEFLGLIFLGGFLCLGDSIMAFLSKEIKSGLIYLLGGLAIIAAGLYFIFFY